MLFWCGITTEGTFDNVSCLAQITIRPLGLDGNGHGFSLLAVVADRAAPRAYHDWLANLLLQPDVAIRLAGLGLAILGLALLSIVSLQVAPPTISRVGGSRFWSQSLWADLDYHSLPALVKMTLAFYWIFMILLVGMIIGPTF